MSVSMSAVSHIMSESLAPDGSILEEFDISHTDAGFSEFFRRVEAHRFELSLPVAIAMEGYHGHARLSDRLVQDKGYRLYNVSNLTCKF